jgi:hypothetical protein
MKIALSGRKGHATLSDTFDDFTQAGLRSVRHLIHKVSRVHHSHVIFHDGHGFGTVQVYGLPHGLHAGQLHILHPILLHLVIESVI